MKLTIRKRVPMNKKFSFWIPHLMFVIAGIVLDQATKFWAVGTLKGNNPIVLIKGVLELRYLENRGAAFGMMQGGRTIFLIITPIVLAAIAYMLYKMPPEPKYRILNILLDCIAVGAIGNMIDRIWLNYVVDFIYFSLINFPIFNVADIFVSVSSVIGAVLILFVKPYKDEDFSFLSLKSKGEEDA